MGKINYICKLCGKAFIDIKGNYHRRYCSKLCASHSRVVHGKKKYERICITCGCDFVTVNKVKRFCKPTCFRWLDASKLKSSISHTGLTHSDETCKKISKANKGKIFSEKTYLDIGFDPG